MSESAIAKDNFVCLSVCLFVTFVIHAYGSRYRDLFLTIR